MKLDLLSPYGWGSLLRLVMVAEADEPVMIAEADELSYGRRGGRRAPLL